MGNGRLKRQRNNERTQDQIANKSMLEQNQRSIHHPSAQGCSSSMVTGNSQMGAVNELLFFQVRMHMNTQT